MIKRLETKDLHVIVCETLEKALSPDTDIPNIDGFVTRQVLLEALIDRQQEMLDRIPEEQKKKNEHYDETYEPRELIRKGIMVWMKGQEREIECKKVGQEFIFKGFKGLTQEYLKSRILNDKTPIGKESFELVKGHLNFSLISTLRNRFNLIAGEAISKEEKSQGRKLKAREKKEIMKELWPKEPFICFEESVDEYTDEQRKQNQREQQLLFVMAEAIIQRMPLRISYKPVKRDYNYEMVFHPHYIRRVQNKVTVYGMSRIENRPEKQYRLVNLILKRVVGVKEADDEKYISAADMGLDYNGSFFRNTMTYNAQLDTGDRENTTEVILKVRKQRQALVNNRTIRTFERLKSEPLHHSQQVIPEREDNEFGYLSLKINDYLYIKPILLKYGSDIEVVSPADLRDVMAQESALMAGVYRGQDN